MLGFQYETTLSFSLFLLSRNKKAFHPAFFTKPYIFGRLLIYIHRSVACTGSLQYWRAVALISRKGHTRITARKWSLVIDRISQHLTGCFGEIRNNGQQCRSASCYSTSLLRTWAKKLFSKRSIPAGRKLKTMPNMGPRKEKSESKHREGKSIRCSFFWRWTFSLFLLNWISQ